MPEQFLPPVQKDQQDQLWSILSALGQHLMPEYMKPYSPPDLGPDTPPGKVGPGEMTLGQRAAMGAVDLASWFGPGLFAKAPIAAAGAIAPKLLSSPTHTALKTIENLATEDALNLIIRALKMGPPEEAAGFGAKEAPAASISLSTRDLEQTPYAPGKWYHDKGISKIVKELGEQTNVQEYQKKIYDLPLDLFEQVHAHPDTKPFHELFPLIGAGEAPTAKASKYTLHQSDWVPEVQHIREGSKEVGTLLSHDYAGKYGLMVGTEHHGYFDSPEEALKHIETILPTKETAPQIKAPKLTLEDIGVSPYGEEGDYQIVANGKKIAEVTDVGQYESGDLVRHPGKYFVEPMQNGEPQYFNSLDEAKKFAMETANKNAEYKEVASAMPEPLPEWGVQPSSPYIPKYIHSVAGKDWTRVLPRELPAGATWPIPEKGKAVGFTVASHHGTGHGEKIAGEGFKLPDYEIGIHFGTPQAAHHFTSHLSHYFSPSVFPVALRAHNPLRMNDLGSWETEKIAEELKRLGFPIEEVNTAAAGSDIQNMRNYIQKKGYDSIVYKNAVEHKGSDSYILMDPSRARVPWAAFDPTKLDSKNLLAGLSGTALTIPELLEALKYEQSPNQ